MAVDFYNQGDQDIYEEGVLNYDEQRKGLLESIHKFVQDLGSQTNE